MHADDNERAGLTPEEARRQAVLAFGGVAARHRAGTATGAAFRSSRPPCRTSATPLRSFRKSPGSRPPCSSCSRSGIGANAAIFTVVNAVLLKPLPFADPDRLVMVWHVPPPAMLPWHEAVCRVGGELPGLGAPPARVRADGNPALQDLHADGPRASRRCCARRACRPGFFEVLGVQPIEGRWFLPEEDQPGREPVVILSHALWQTRFGGDRSIVGRRVLLDGVPYTVVGIMGPAFTFPDWAQLWTPLAWTEKERAVRGEHSLMVVARLAPGVDVSARHRRRWRRSRGPSSRSTRKTTRAGARSWCPCATTWSATCRHVAARAARRRGVRAADRVRERRQPRARPHAVRGAAKWPSASRSVRAPGASCGRC